MINKKEGNYLKSMLFSEFAFGGACYPGLTAMKFIQYTAPTKLAVVQGGIELMAVDLQDFSVPIQLSQKTSFILPAHSQSYLPISTTTFEYCGMTASGQAKFATFLPCYPTGTTSTEMFIEWINADDIAFTSQKSPVDIVASGFNPRNANDISSIPGGDVGYTGATAWMIATDGGLKIWSPEDGTILLNKWNSGIADNGIDCVTHDGNGNIWIGSRYNGIYKAVYGAGNYTFTNYNTLNSDIVANNIRDIMTFGSKVALATNSGISIFDTAAATGSQWSNYSKQNVNQIKSDSFNQIYIDGSYIIGAADTGVYVYTISSGTWQRYGGPMAGASGTSGWTGGNNVNALEVVSGEVFAGTDGNLLTFTIGATSVTDIPNPALKSTVNLSYVFGASGSTVSFINTGATNFAVFDDAIVTGSLTAMRVAGATVNFTATYIPATFPSYGIAVGLSSSGATGASLSFSYQRVKYHTVSGINYYNGALGADTILVSYQEGGISRYNVLTSSWDFNYNGSTGSTGVSSTSLNYGVHFLTRDHYFGNGYGYSKFNINQLSVTDLPADTENGDILFSYPQNNTGNWGLSQSAFIAFSKPVSVNSLTSHFSWGTAPSFGGQTFAAYSYQGGEVFEVSLPYDPVTGEHLEFGNSQGVSFRITSGLTATDGTYFRQTVSSTYYTMDVTPRTGWNVLGSQLTLSGAEGNLLGGLIFRNPQDFPVEVLVLAAI